jgi:hypothetical protein
VPVSFPGTISSQFTSKAAQAWGWRVLNGPYLALYVAGFSDGRTSAADELPAGYVSGFTAQSGLGAGITEHLVNTFMLLPYGCADRNVQC